MDESDLIVHHFTRTDSDYPLTSTLLYEGYQAVRSVSSATGWINVAPPTVKSAPKGTRNSYVYNAALPTLAIAHAPSEPPPEWKTDGSVATSAEIFRTEDLDDFESTDLGHLSLPPQKRSLARSASTLPADRRRPRPSTDRSLSPPRKRQRLELASLSRSIPLPHYHGILSTASTTEDSEMGTVNFFPRATPRPLPPYATENISQILDDPYARYSWVIPIRGTLPWQLCTSATMIQSGDTGMVLPSPPMVDSGTTADHTTRIEWTKDSVLSFWSFLLQLREASNFGPLAVSFHAAPAGSSPPFSTRPNITDSNEHLRSRPPESQQEEWVRLQDASLSNVDHFKVYHSSRYTAGLRNILNAWSYKYAVPSVGIPKTKDDPPKGVMEAVNTVTAADSAGPPMKIRMLRGGRLVLLDERGRGLLTC